MSTLSQQDAEREVRDRGFSIVYTHTDRPNAYYAPHKHAGLTTHLILRGELTIAFPGDSEPKSQTFCPGARVDVDAGRSHEVWVGAEGCTMVIGE